MMLLTTRKIYIIMLYKIMDLFVKNYEKDLKIVKYKNFIKNLY
jgi:hypothetical protein